MNRFLLLLLGSTVVLGLVSLHLVRELREERDNSQSLQARIEALQTTPAPPAPPAPAITGPATAFPPPHATGAFAVLARPDAAAAAPAAAGRMLPPPSQEAIEQAMRENLERQRALLQNPEYREAMKAQQKLMLTRTYPDLDRELGLDAEQFDQMLSLLADQGLRQMENQSWGDHLAGRDQMEEFQRKAQQQQQQQANEAELATLLGGEKFREWKDYQSTMGVRYQVTQLRSTLAASGEPLEQDQVKPLLKAMANEQQRMMKDYQKDAQRLSSSTTAVIQLADPKLRMTATEPSFNQVQWQEQNLERITQHNKRMRDAVAPILTAEQLRHFEREQNEQLRMQEVQMRMMRAQAEAAARGDLPPQGLMVTDPTMATPVSPR